jgi:hypothetical protein
MEPTRSAAAAAPNAPSVDLRRDKRLPVAVPVKLFLTADSTTPQLCCTYEISLIGARLVAVSGITKVGQTVWLQRQNRRAKYRVIWIGEQGTPHANQVGVEVMEPGNIIWENELRARMMQR